MDKTAQAISTNEALLLQQLSECGEEELNDIAQEMREPRGRILSQLDSLKRKGLIQIKHNYGEVIVSLTRLGKRTINYVWPEAYA